MPGTNNTADEFTHWVMMVIEGQNSDGTRQTANRCFTFNPEPGSTMSNVFTDLLAKLKADNPSISKPLVTYFDVRPNKIL
ncbi:hypothetical protein ABT095_15100 [Kitasatospora sp. NPDC002227]|uniref:hypothetical protein n=1 Tax=Kitasatospora sp. NPDC002227 TaxID=3154773 RepID=UPI00332F047A